MDPTGMFLYGHGFMGLDNISLFDRSELPTGVHSLKQVILVIQKTAFLKWTGDIFYCQRKKNAVF